MTERLYYNNSYLFEFKAMVIRVNDVNDHFDITLDKTAFYPESGGQSSDGGRLDGHELIGVMENDSGDIVHRVNSWSVPEGGTVGGEIDRMRRLDNMRKHTGQHILSAAFLRLAQAETVSAHLGGGESTIELATSGLDEALIHEAELLANEVVMENQSVETGYYTRDELKGMSVRKIPDREGKLRIIQIGRFDITACGGTHCRATGELGPLKIIGGEKIRGRFRISFLSGRAAVEDYHEKDRVLNSLTKKLTCHYRNLDDSIGNLVSRNSELKKEVAALQRKLLPYDIERLINNGIEINGIKIVVDTIDKREAGDLKRLVIGVAQSCRAIAVISDGDNMSIGVSSKIDYMASKVAEKIKEKFGGRGGGSQSYAQVGGLDKISAGEVAEYLAKIVKDEIT